MLRGAKRGKSMKWAILVLVVLGIVAALSATFLVNALRTEKNAELSGKGEVNALVATRSLPAMSWVTSQHIAVKKLPRKGLAVDYLSDPTQVIGKVLAVPIVKDQVLTRSSLIIEGSGAQLAAALPPGMRAVSVPVSQYSVMGGLLYPGCLVDVIATFRLRSGNTEKGQAISTTLLHNVQVLAVQNESIVSKAEKQGVKDKISGGYSSQSQLSVTLMVNTKQTEALQLAMDNGKITLAMRNPLDRKVVDSDATVLSEGRLVKLGELLGSSVSSAPGEGYIDSNDPNQARDSSAVTQDEGAERLSKIFSEGMGSPSGRKNPQWQITVIRGQDVKEELINIPGADVKAER